VSSISANSPVTSPSSGSRSWSWRVSRIASLVSSTRWRASPELAVSLVEDQVQDVQHGGDALGDLRRRGRPELGAAGLDPLLGAAAAQR
jgi:hypothetical protein